MFDRLATPYIASMLILVSSLGWAGPRCHAQQKKKPFTVSDDIGITLFRTVGTKPKKLRFSPNGNYFTVYTERGRLDLNRVEDSLRFYRSQDVEDFLKHSNGSQPPSPVWVVSVSDEQGPVIREWRWLADSSGVAFLERTGATQHLVLGDLQKKKIEALTSTTETVKDFDIRDRRHYVYIAADAVAQREEPRPRRQAPAIVGTGHQIADLLFPATPISGVAHSRFWAVVGGKRFEVKMNGAPVVPAGDLTLSPDGQSVVTHLVVPEVPLSWETLYPSPDASYPYRIRAGRRGLQSGLAPVRQYVLIDLQTGSAQSLVDAPESNDASWFTLGSPQWSTNGQAILLPGTFLSPKDRAPSRPCVAVVDLHFNTRTCVETLTGMDLAAIEQANRFRQQGHTETSLEEGYHTVMDVRFIDGDRNRVMVSFSTLVGSAGNTEYRSTADGIWQIVGQSKGEYEVGPNGLEIEIEEAFDRPPMLVAKEKQESRVIWDPNPQLKNVEMGQASAYRWKGKEGRDWTGLLYRPANFKPEQRYPLVIQTHGFSESEFDPSGKFPTAFAARELTTTGILVLQVADETFCRTLKPDEGPCVVSDYEAAAEQLVSEGLVNPEKIGIIGFSRTCFYVMEMLTTGSLRMKAASITDGVMAGYPEYMFFDSGSKAFDSMIGAPPFGEGLQQWLRQSPGFNLDKITTPLLVNAEGRTSLLYMWEPYAGLRYLHKPVDLIILNTHEHVLTNPAVRMASQGGSVDWFRFWLQDYENPDPAKAEQYTRWRELRRLQRENEHKLVAPQVSAN